MRIITGEFKHRRLMSPDNYDIRPTSDKVKEALFSILMFDVPKAICCDLFAGTGNLGLEAISRGAAKCWFADSSGQSIKFIKENIKMCGAEDRSEVLKGDYRKTLGKIDDKIDIFFLDPPYKAGLYKNVLSMIDELDLLNSEGVIICEHDIRDEIPEEVGGLVLSDTRKYGKTAVTFFVRKEDATEGDGEIDG